jgi:hypothetical protein
MTLNLSEVKSDSNSVIIYCLLIACGEILCISTCAVYFMGEGMSLFFSCVSKN